MSKALVMQRLAHAGAVLDSAEYRPESDAAAKNLIRSLNHYEWDTHQVRGKFTQTPWSLTAQVRGCATTIHLPGRFGSVLPWLDRKQREQANAPVTYSNPDDNPTFGASDE